MNIERPFQGKSDSGHLRKMLMLETKDGPAPLLEFAVYPEVMIEISEYDFSRASRSWPWWSVFPNIPGPWDSAPDETGRGYKMKLTNTWKRRLS